MDFFFVQEDVDQLAYSGVTCFFIPNKIIPSLVPCERLANTVLPSSRRMLRDEFLGHMVLILTALEGSIRQKMLTENGPTQIKSC